jgi:hypothetical protein
MRRKARLIAKLTDLQRETLFIWLAREGLPISEVRRRLEREFGIVASFTALTAFWKIFCHPRIVNIQQPGSNDAAPSAPGVVVYEITLQIRQPADCTVSGKNFSIAVVPTSPPAAPAPPL